jgi:hypothetical protein
VGGRDYVTDRLSLEKSFAMDRMEVAESEKKRVLDLWEAGLASDTERDQVLLALREMESERDRIQGRIDVRRQFLDGRLEGLDPERAVEILETEKRIQAAEGALVEARTHRERVAESLVPPSKVPTNVQGGSYAQGRDLMDRLDERIEAGLVERSEIEELIQARIEEAHLNLEVAFLKRKLEALKGTVRMGLRGWVFGPSSSRDLPPIDSGPASP